MWNSNYDDSLTDPYMESRINCLCTFVFTFAKNKIASCFKEAMCLLLAITEHKCFVSRRRHKIKWRRSTLRIAKSLFSNSRMQHIFSTGVKKKVQSSLRFGMPTFYRQFKVACLKCMRIASFLMINSQSYDKNNPTMSR